MIRIDLVNDGITCHAEPTATPVHLGGQLLPLLLAALLQAHADGYARAERPCTRVALRERIAGWPELHRTQLWRALGRLEGTPLAGLIGYLGRSSGPFWLDGTVLADCVFEIRGVAVDRATLGGFLGQRAGIGEPMPSAGADGVRQTAAHRGRVPGSLLAPAFVAALTEADHLLDRGELYPARNALERADTYRNPDDDAAAAALSVRRARIARRLGDWRALQDELRALGAIVAHGHLPLPARRQWEQRIHVLHAWHLYGSLGYPAAALERLDAVDAELVDTDLALRSEYLNLRGIVLRELARQQRDAGRAAGAIGCLGEAVHCAALGNMPDQLQIGTANLANTLSQLLDAGLLPVGNEDDLRAPVRWLLLSESICVRWGIGRSSLLNIVFLLRLAADHGLAFGEVTSIARELGHSLDATSFADLARRTWDACGKVQSQLPADQRAAFLFMWAHHAGKEHDYVTAFDLCKQVLHQCRKLRDADARQRYADAVGALRARMNAALAPGARQV